MGDLVQQRSRDTALTVTMLSGVVDPLKCGSQVCVEVRLRQQIRRLPPVSVHPTTGAFSYEGIPPVQLKEKSLDDIFDDSFFVVLRSWHPSSDWTDAALIKIPVRTIGLTLAGEREFRSFVLEPVADEFVTDDSLEPSVVLSATLQSPFRPPVESVVRLLQGYASGVDIALDTVSEQTSRVAPFFNSRAALVPAIPIGVIALASLPVVCVVGVASLPLLVPILLVLTAAAVIGGLAAGAVWAGSRSGRPWLQRAIRPVYDKVGKADPEVLYPIGPGPSLAHVVRSLTPTTMWPKLAMSVLVDFIGCTSYAIPVLGESADILWAPMSYLIIDAMYHDSTPWAGLFGAIEEILPFTDIIPTATLAWIKEYLPLMARNMHAAATGRPQQQQQPQQQRQQGSVYHSDGDVGGEQYPR